MLTQEESYWLTIFAEQHYCKECAKAECEHFTNGEYEKCPNVLEAFLKNQSEYHAFLNSVQKPFIPGKCVFCRNEEMNDRDNNYTPTTLRNHDGTIRMRGYLCSYHHAMEWV